MSRRVRATGVVALALFQAALSSCAADAGQTSQSIFGGVNDTVHTNILGIVIQSRAGIGECTGSLIAPNLVLTARHCVSTISGEGVVCQRTTMNGMTYEASTAGAPYAPSSFFVTTDNVISQDPSRYTRVAEVWVPDNTTNQPMCGKDIALLRLATNITSVQPVIPRVNLPPRAMELFTASGYGATSARGGGSGTRRMRDGLGVQFVGLVRGAGGFVLMTDEEWLADTGTCQGDSGGPALDELGAVFGVLSRGDSTSCNSPIYTRVDSYATWIRERTRAAAMSGNYPLPSWVEPAAARPGAMGDECASELQCEPPLLCLPVGTTRRCTLDDCSLCPSGWVCNADGNRCILDPSIPPPPPADSGVPEPDASAPDAGTMPPGQMSGGCSVHTHATRARSQRDVMLALSAAAAVALAARKRSRGRR